MKKERIVFTIVWISIIGFVVFTFFKNRSHEYKPLPLESRKDIVWLAKKYDLPLETVLEIKTGIRADGNWVKSIEAFSKETGVPEKTIASILIEGENTFYGGSRKEQPE